MLAVLTCAFVPASAPAVSTDEPANNTAAERGGAVSRFWNSAEAKTQGSLNPATDANADAKSGRPAISSGATDLVSQLWSLEEDSRHEPIAVQENSPRAALLQQPGFISPSGHLNEAAAPASRRANASARAETVGPISRAQAKPSNVASSAKSLVDQLTGLPPVEFPLSTDKPPANKQLRPDPKTFSFLPEVSELGPLTVGLWEPLVLTSETSTSVGNSQAAIELPLSDLQHEPVFSSLLLQPFVLSNNANEATLVAYQEELPPSPPPGDNGATNAATPDDERPEAEGAGTDNENDSLAEAEQVGEEPEDNTLDFLRTETVLLEPGESQCDVGINYLLVESDFPVLLTDGMGNIVGVDEVNFRVRELTVPLEYRVGLHKRVQGFVGAPIGWSNTQVSLDTFEAFENDGGLGDIDFGLTMQLVDAAPNCPYVIATIQATAPTGGDPFRNAIGLAPTAPSLGQGFWSIAGNLLFIQPYDPVVVFYGVGTEHFFSRRFLGLEIEPGAQYNYTFGVGFAVNERITLSTRFFGAYVEEIKVDGERRLGTNAEPMTLRMSATISRPCDRLVEPFVEFGLTDDSAATFLGITWTY